MVMPDKVKEEFYIEGNRMKVEGTKHVGTKPDMVGLALWATDGGWYKRNMSVGTAIGLIERLQAAVNWLKEDKETREFH
jgi:hypothetical protein